MDALFSNFLYITLNDVLDIIIVAFIFYQLFGLIRETRAHTLIKGLFVVMVVWKISEWAQLRMLQFLIKNMMTLGLIALIIVFQPELRRGLEYLGRSKLIQPTLGYSNDEIINTIDEIVQAVSDMAKQKTGALIVIEREIGLNELATFGVDLDAKVSSELLRNIFFKNSPMHDGAVIIRNNKIKSAGCILPLSQNGEVSKDLGTRHRAALGIVEKSDSIVVVVSEENGAISLSYDNQLMRFLDESTLASVLRSKLKVVEKQALFSSIWRKPDEKK